jgi:hypothetical protein
MFFSPLMFFIIILMTTLLRYTTRPRRHLPKRPPSSPGGGTWTRQGCQGRIEGSRLACLKPLEVFFFFYVFLYYTNDYLTENYAFTPSSSRIPPQRVQQPTKSCGCHHHLAMGHGHDKEARGGLRARDRHVSSP